jgi:hypothetical protein
MKTILAVVLGTAFAPWASAGCGSMDPPAPAVSFKPAAYSDRGEVSPIAGLWKFTFVSKGSVGIPDGTVVDSGYTAWHSDGTELMNSGRAPLTGSFCMGVWAKTGEFTYTLNHYALSWDPTGNVFVGPANIRENITLDYSGTGFTGTFTLVQFDTHGNTVGTVTGIVTATRVTVDTP